MLITKYEKRPEFIFRYEIMIHLVSINRLNIYVNLLLVPGGLFPRSWRPGVGAWTRFADA